MGGAGDLLGVFGVGDRLKKRSSKTQESPRLHPSEEELDLSQMSFKSKKA